MSTEASRGLRRFAVICLFYGMGGCSGACSCLGSDDSDSDSDSDAEGCGSSSDEDSSSGCGTSGADVDAGFGGSQPGPTSCTPPPHTLVEQQGEDCVFIGCEDGWGDCDEDQVLCERSLRANSDHCGACANQCAEDEICSEGSCRDANIVYTPSSSGRQLIAAASSPETLLVVSSGSAEIAVGVPGALSTVSSFPQASTAVDVVLGTFGNWGAVIAEGGAVWSVEKQAGWGANAVQQLPLSRVSAATTDNVHLWVSGSVEGSAGSGGGGGTGAAGGVSGSGGVAGGGGLAAAGQAGVGGASSFGGSGGVSVTGGAGGLAAAGGAAGASAGGSGGTGALPAAAGSGGSSGAAGQGGVMGMGGVAGAAGGPSSLLLSVDLDGTNPGVVQTLGLVPSGLAANATHLYAVSSSGLQQVVKSTGALTSVPGFSGNDMAWVAGRLYVVNTATRMLHLIQDNVEMVSVASPGPPTRVAADERDVFVVVGSSVYQWPAALDAEPTLAIGALSGTVDIALTQQSLFVADSRAVVRVAR